jgi:predicted nucleotidyltransferase
MSNERARRPGTAATAASASADAAPSRLDLRPEHLNVVCQILRQYIPEHEVRAFGSRAGGRPKPFSDLDLLALSRQPIEPLRWALLHEAFAESDLPFKVDLIDWSTADTRLRERLLNGSILVQAGATP